MNLTMHRSPETLSFAGLFAFIALLPFGRLSEFGVLLALIASVWKLFLQRDAFVAKVRQGFALSAFFLIFLAALVSCVDAVQTKESVLGTLGLLRFAGLVGAAAMLGDAARERLGRWILVVLLIWSIDAAFQAVFGQSLRGEAAFDRLTGLFGQDNPKLGLVLAALSPIALFYAPSKHTAVLLIWPSLAVVILLAGARAGWLMFTLVSLAWVFRLVNYQLGRTLKWAVCGLFFISISGLGLYQINDRFASRIDRSAKALHEQGLDVALAGRLPIWQTATRMAKAHSINGVGVRGFRFAYPEFASQNDPWVQPSEQGMQGATHPHQLLLEILSETGIFGIACWLAVLWLIWRAHGASLASGWPWACALGVLLFPINTHTAMYSSFWAGVMWFLMAMTSAAWASRSLGAFAEDPEPALAEPASTQATDAASNERPRLQDPSVDIGDGAGGCDGD
jgi:O-antigen ligase